MQEKKAEIRVIFASSSGEQSLIFHIQPEEGIQLVGDSPELQELMPHIAGFNDSHPAATQNVLGYERVFVDAISGNHTLFTTHEEVLAAWKIVNNIIEAWAKNGHGLRHYPEGSAEIA
jgi:glucose-6-phosphate 1-dehydrogenase